MTTQEFMETETKQGATYTTAKCGRCNEEKDTADLIFCSQGSCSNEVCVDCQSETENALEVCGDRCAANKIEAMKRELAAFQAQASTAAAIVRRGAAGYLNERQVA